MRETTYTDGEGCRFKVRLPVDASDDDAYKGIVVGPPDLTGLGLPQEMRVKLNNALFDSGFFTKRDVTKRFPELIGVWQRVLGVDVQRIQAMYEVELGV